MRRRWCLYGCDRDVGTPPRAQCRRRLQTESQALGETDAVVGVFMPGLGGAPRLVQRLNDIAADGSPHHGDPDPDGFLFSPDGKGRYLVVIPADPAAVVKVSARHTLLGARVKRTFTVIGARNGMATLDFGAKHVPGDEVVEVIRHGRSVVHSFISATLAPEPRSPANVVGDWGVNGLFLGGSRLDGFRDDEDITPWLRKIGADPAQPVTTGPSGVPIAATPEGGRVWAEQVWLPGDAAHTLVTQEGPGSGGRPFDQPVIVSDRIVPAGQNPLFAVRLRHRQGWFVGSGPARRLTGWREMDGQWHLLEHVPVALVASMSKTLQLRLSDGTVTTHTS